MILGAKARNHPQQVARNGVDDTVDDRRTPLALWEDLNQRHRFTLDAAASAENALCTEYFTRARDGLAARWSGHRVWCNPPYSDVRAWVGKAWAEMGPAAGPSSALLVVMLLPNNRMEQPWWQELVEPYRDRPSVGGLPRLTARFLAGRPRFGRPGGAMPTRRDRPPFGLVLLTWTPT